MQYAELLHRTITKLPNMTIIDEGGVVFRVLRKDGVLTLVQSPFNRVYSLPTKRLKMIQFNPITYAAIERSFAKFAPKPPV